ncbi:MAG: DMT family transporter, partial [Alphaproteobacteria bacterium]|nr:DMT family transporter [Alphaproteobacteria bacterium]
MTPPHFALMVLICAVWGFNFVAAKAALEAFPPLLAVGLRFLLLGLLLAPVLRPFAGRMRDVLALSVFAGSLHFGLMFAALSRADASVMAIVTQLNVPMATVLSIVFLSETVGWRRWLGIGLSFVGVAIIAADGSLNATAHGVGLGVLASLSYAGGMIFIRRLRGVPALSLQAWVGLMSWPPLLLASLLFETGQGAAIATAPLPAWAGLLFTVLGASLVGHVGMTWLLQRYEVSLTAPLTLMAPLFGVVFGIWLLDDPVSWRFVLGGLVTLSGVAVIALRHRRPDTPAAILPEPGIAAVPPHARPRPAPPPR